MTTAVSFELAKLLKEKGFSQRLCEYGYTLDGEESFDYSLDKINGNAVGAPKITEVVMWLYEKYGIWIDVSFDSWNTNNFSWSIQKKKDKSFHYDNTDEYQSPTEAYEAAILYTLNNLI